MNAANLRNPATAFPQETPAPVSGAVIADHFVQPVGYATWRSRGTHDWLLTVTNAGVGRYGFLGGEYYCRAGDIVLLAPNTPHDYASADPEAPWDFYWAHFVPRPHWLAWLQLPPLAPGLMALALHDEMARQRIGNAFERLLVDSRGAGAYRDELALNGLEEALIVIAGQHVRVGQQLDPRVEQIMQRLARVIDRAMSIEDLAESVALSPSRLAHLFKQHVGDSIGRVHMQMRLRHAARLLEFTTRSVAEIAQDVGFSSPFHFSHQFKLAYGCSPQAYRRNMQTTVEAQRAE